MKWFVKITTENGWFWLDTRGYKTKREAKMLAEQAMRIPQNIRVEIIKEVSR